MNISGMISFDLADWGGYAACYDALNELSPYQELQRIVRDEVGSLAGKRILDAGCGTGNLLVRFLEREDAKEAEIWGVDFSGEMLTRAREKCGDQVHFLNTNLNQNLPFPDAWFDVITSLNTLYALLNPQKTLSEFRRVLKPGGKLVLVTPKQGYENGLILREHCKSSKSDEYWFDIHGSPERESELIREAIQDETLACQMQAVAQYNRQIGNRGAFHFFEQVELGDLMESCGFGIVKTCFVYARQNIMMVTEK